MKLGKVDENFLVNVILENLGADREDILVGPGPGLDNTVIALNGKEVIIVTSDPLSFIPSVGVANSAWLTLSLLASDYTTSGNMPEYAFFTFNLPPDFEGIILSRYLKALSHECKKLGVNIAGGHTGRYPGCNLTIVGAGVLMGKAKRNNFVTPSMAKEGDSIIITKGAAIASTAILAYSFPETIRKALGEKILEGAREMLKECSTVRDAIVASSVGLRKKVTSMHDATEGGVLGGLYELSKACGKAVYVNLDKIPIKNETESICKLFSIDPLVSVSEGTLIITCKEEYQDEVLQSLEKNYIFASAVGNIRRGQGLWIRKDGKEYHLFVPPESDPYWKAYSDAIGRGWK
jgi:hydrogenase maturation factor